ncbi:potassium-transporting ATPase subunit KdpA [Terracoccus luteus]|uniref:Potassium-transporting ATPase potassium-binding subunit n=1 Tax=Terracoccus luteus TaxID=53356 RepID=A0A839PNN1_9MICO|nr:potassium-transporting ATPase subunit KdpA [Terracoccus luteus]MBB2985117.1 K+-transporting ATPase ATPase A chain [Terracoccus luteus]MCP2170769.1 K+-transporting ATPase ATPase A chain [Terracoccus luteus]
MSDTVSGLLTIGVLVAALAAAHVPLGGWMAKVFTDERDWRVESLVYRLCRVDPRSEQRWGSYAVAVLGFSVVGIVLLFLLIALQGVLPLARGASMHLDTALNTAVSFVTNTNWQSYAGEAGASPVVQALGLTVQNFVSPAVGLAVAIALVRGLVRSNGTGIGNFWVDLVRGTVRVLLPVALVGAVVLLLGGVVQNLAAPTSVTTLDGGQQVVQGGLVASQEAIKMLGTNGGGYFNANSAHPFENPTPLTNLVEIFLMLVVPFSLPRTYGILVGDRRQGVAVLGFMATLWGLLVAVVTWAEVSAASGPLGGMEGKEVRFGSWASALFGASTTGTSTGAVNSMHESYSALGGGGALFGMLLGEVAPGGVGTGLYGALLLAVLTVFLSGLMVGRTPELLGKQIGRREITLTALALLVMPALVLSLTGIAMVAPIVSSQMLASGPHGLTEVMYAYTSASNNNGSAFAGLSADTPYLNLTLALAMLLGRFVPIVLTLALAGSLVAQRRRPTSAGTLPTHTPTFAGLFVAVAVVVTGLTFFPALALGPLAEALA